MEKLVYLCWDAGPPAGRPARGDALRDRLLADVVPKLERLGGARIGVNVHDTPAAAAPSPAPAPEGEAVVVAQVSVWVPSYDRRGALDDALLPLADEVAGYRVLESLYDDYGTTPHAAPRSWPAGERSPGVLTVACIHRPEGLDEATFVARWHGVQSPRSGELQPRCRYVRNEVVRPLQAGAPAIDGIVEEAWPSVEDVADPMRFFNAGGDPGRLQANVAAMFESVEACLDLARLRSTTMSEHLCF